MKILKFGGSSVANADRIKHIGNILSERLRANESLSVVFSAFQGVTDELIETANIASRGDEIYLARFEGIVSRHTEVIEQLFSDAEKEETLKQVLENMKVLKNLLRGVYLVMEASPRTLDYILSFGERNSTFIISQYFSTLGFPAVYVDARNIIRTNKEFGEAKVHIDKTRECITEHYATFGDRLNMVTGFIASDLGGLTTTLGRGGSDYTAAILAGILGAESLEIWTDVDGVLTSNPKLVKNAYTIEQLSYDEAMELSHFGAKVIYPPTIQPALSKSIPIWIKNTFNPSFQGTLISREKTSRGKRKITGVTSVSDISLLTLEGSGLVGIPGTAARLFNALGKNNINIIMITQASSEHSICFALKSERSKKAILIIEEEFEKELAADLIKPIKEEKDLSLLAVIGEKMKSVPGVAGSLFKSLGHNGINIVAIAQGSSELNITFAIRKSDEEKALNLVHDAFFLSENKRINVYLVGVGLIGGTLLKQISTQSKALLDKHLDIRVVGMANSRKMAFDRDGLDLENWREALQGNSYVSDFQAFIDHMTEMNLPNSVFVDCTADNTIKNFYPQILGNNISISTANKSANSSSYQEFTALQRLALTNNVQFLYETNVGAGLPVLSTLSGLFETGDRIESIRAVISGSLSYIFNKYSPGKSFKELIVEARELGYTEPDPRDDLSGQDVKRKIIILSRVAGYPIEPEDVEVEDILPESCMQAESIEEFYQELDRNDEYFRSLIEKAHNENSKLRYLATLEQGKASIQLAFVNQSSPFYNLSSTDNMIVFHTARYKERPLVVQGPGAGADVTAAGVFTEIIQLGSAVL